VFLVKLVYFNSRNNLPKSGTFLLGHSVCIYIYIYFDTVGKHWNTTIGHYDFNDCPHMSFDGL